ncbi:hypothetical protein DFH06DRAFT_1189445 [Mycena polygramma]|nr:hypothetical protein DFH06DRAFT_1189445 [Mycena polygramma]
MSICEKCGHQSPSLGATGRTVPQLSPLPSSQLSVQNRRVALADVKSQIALYKKRIEDLEKDQSELETSLSLVVYPVHTLPFDVTSRIFVHCLPSHGRVSASPSRAPLLLAQICRHWREVAIATCGLWRSLYFDPGIDFDTVLQKGTLPDEAFQNLLRCWFSRARGIPLALGVNFQYRKASQAFLELVLSYAPQIERLDLHLWPAQFEQLRPLRTHFPILRHFATVHSSDVDALNLIQTSPSIRELRLLNDTERDFSVPFLTHLEISAEITAETFIAVLRNFPLLTQLAFSLRESDSYSIAEASHRPTPIVCPHLSSLTMGGSAYALRLVTLPNLRSMNIAPFSETEEVQQFISRSACTVEHLVISFRGCDEEEDAGDLLGWLEVFPSISVLEARECQDLSLLLQHLDSALLVPRLTDVSIDSEITKLNIDSVYDDDLIEMLHHRRDWAETNTLRKFHLKLTYLFGEKDDVWFPGYLAKSALEQLMADGLDCVFRLEHLRAGNAIWPATAVDSGYDRLPEFP